jgi:hypothetical protein
LAPWVDQICRATPNRVQGSHNKLDFEPLNIHPQCIRCNRWLHGNLGSYSLWLIRTYGPDILETIDTLERDWKPLTSEELQAIYLK